MDRSGTSVFTETVTLDERDSNRQDTREDVPVLTLRVAKPKCSKQVQWTDGTVDNEHLNRRKSKCCCIYEKPRAFGESSSESDDECENCYGHVEKKKKNRKKKPDGDPNDPVEQPDPDGAQDGAEPSTS